MTYHVKHEEDIKILLTESEAHALNALLTSHLWQYNGLSKHNEKLLEGITKALSNQVD